ncbi:MAG: Wzz/FepE/Etk N-terminal domain-containing protein [Cytophagales bacterium]|nr:Wzz/FepE/Etk N-terminal domain-containing protein [Cytophagales bacterium]
MTDNQKQSGLQNSDEIDLLELLAKLVITIKSNFKLIAGAFVVGSLLGLAYNQFVPKTYESRMLSEF